MQQATIHRFIACVIALGVSLTPLLPNVAMACGPAIPIDPYAIPLAGATNVPTTTSLTIVSVDHPWWVTLTANGVPIPVDGVDSLGGNMTPYANYWRVRGTETLQPNTEYVLTMATTASGEAFEVTRFTTSEGYDKEKGTPPKLESLALWRVRYPVEDIGAGGCVFSEFHSFADLKYSPAEIPDTPPEATLYRLQTYPKSGWAGQAIMFTGDHLFVGSAPEGSYPFPSWWPAALDPSTEHCFSITVWGYGDRSRGPLTSNVLCASVTDLVAVDSLADDSVPDAFEDVEPTGDHVDEEDSTPESDPADNLPTVDTHDPSDLPTDASASGNGTGCSIGRIDPTNAGEGFVVVLLIMVLAVMRVRRREPRSGKAAQQTA